MTMFDWLFPWRNIARQLDRIEYQQALIEDHINEGNNRIMATLEALQAKVTDLEASSDALGTDVGEAVDELRRLGDIIRAGGDVPQADIDALTDRLAAVQDKLTGQGTTLDDAVAEDETPPA